MSHWTFVPSLSKEVGCKLNGQDLQCGWHHRTVNGIKCIILVLEHWNYISLVNENFELIHMQRYGKEISIDENNKIMVESIDK
jgi:hypothetical protein